MKKPERIGVYDAGPKYRVGFYFNPYTHSYDNVWWLIKRVNPDGSTDHSEVVGRGTLYAIDTMFDEETLFQFCSNWHDWPSWVTDPKWAKCNPRAPHVVASVQDLESDPVYAEDAPDNIPDDVDAIEYVERVITFELHEEPESDDNTLVDHESMVVDGYWQYWKDQHFHMVHPNDIGVRAV